VLTRVVATLVRAVSIRRRTLGALGGATLIALAGGCSFDHGPDIESATNFDRFPIYWLGADFEGRELSHVTAEDWSTAAVLIYGTCDPSSALEPSCQPPISVQIFPLCHHLDSVALPPRERPRVIRGAPVGTQDGAHVLLTQRTQIKVYRGEGTDPGIALRALEVVRSLNSVSPVISATDPIPPPPPGVLDRKRPCTD
jgi:hypothetical protein